MTDFTPPRRLTAEDDADGFDCGLPVVNDWLRNQLRNAGKQHTAVAYATFCDGALAGFYTLSAYSISHAEANGWLRRNSPDPIPAILLGMLGVDMRYQTMHVGAQLLRDAAMRAMGSVLNLQLSWLAISRALMGTMVSITFRLFSFNVVPVSTMSTMTSDRLSTGAISMEPFRCMISISRPRPV